MKLSRSSLLLPIALIAMRIGTLCAADSPDDVLAETKLVKLTRADYDAAMAKIPADLRDEFATSSRRLTMLLNNVLVKKTLALQAQQAGLEPDPETLAKAPDDREAALAAAQVHAIEETGGAEFDARLDSLVATARENYHLKKDEYKTVEERRISAIQISTQTRGKEAALALATQTRDKLLAGFDFAALARQVSEDKDSAANGGQLPWATAEEMNPTLAKTAFALKKTGDISEPVLIGTSYIVARLDETRGGEPLPFDEVKDSIMEQMRADYIRDYRERKLDAIRSDPAMKINHAAIDALVVHIDPERMKPPTVPPLAPREKDGASPPR